LAEHPALQLGQMVTSRCGSTLFIPFEGTLDCPAAVGKMHVRNDGEDHYSHLADEYILHELQTGAPSDLPAEVD